MKVLIILIELICSVENAGILVICKLTHVGPHYIYKWSIGVISCKAF